MMTRAPWQRGLRALVPLAVTSLLVAVPFVLLGELPGERWLSARDAHAPTFAGLGVGLLALDIVLPIPSSVVGTMLGGRLGWALGFLCSWIGLTLGHTAGYAVGRFAPERWLRGAPRSLGGLGVFSTRPVPVLAEAVALTAGAVRMPWPAFATAMLAGNAVYAAVLALTGAALLPRGAYLWALLGPLLLGASGFGYWRWRGERRGNPSRW